MKITDAERTKVIEIPSEHAATIGLFKDMVEVGADEGEDPVSQPNWSDRFDD